MVDENKIDSEEFEFNIDDLLETEIIVLTNRKAYSGTVKKVKGVLLVVAVTNIEDFFPINGSERFEDYEDEPLTCVFSLLSVTLEVFKPIEDLT